MADTNTLGLDVKPDDAQDTSDATEKPTDDDHNPSDEQQPSPAKSKPSADAPALEKKKPYVNPERVKTGGTQRDKLTEDELTERMARIREQNEKIKQRRIDVQADEEAFKKTQQAERARIAQNKKVQANVDRTREQNAQRKMDKIQSREWDSGKSAGEWKSPRRQSETPTAPLPAAISSSPANNAELPKGTTEFSEAAPHTAAVPSSSDRGGRGSIRGRGMRGRGRGRGSGPVPAPPSAPAREKSPEAKSEPKAAVVELTAAKE